VDDQLELGTVAQADRREVTHVNDSIARRSLRRK
jgi:hypothetical protein